MKHRLFAVMIAACALAPAAAQTTNGQPVTPAAPPTAAPVDKNQEVICKREKETGSLVKAKRTCLTRQQWAYVLETNSNFARDLADSTRSRPGSQ